VARAGLPIGDLFSSAVLMLVTLVAIYGPSRRRVTLDELNVDTPQQ